MVTVTEEAARSGDRVPAPVLSIEDAFFEGLRDGDRASLEPILSDDFVIVDVMRGATADRSELLGAVAARQLRFTELRVVERSVRRYGPVAIVVGRTSMRGRVGAEEFATASRYTHVFARGEAGEWRLVSAQGTQIVE